METMQLAKDCIQFYGLTEAPFGLTPDTDFYIDLPSQKQAFDMLMYALASGEGFIKVTGEVGTGKTMLCRRLLNTLEQQDFISAYIPNPAVDADGLWHAIAREFVIDHSRFSDSTELRAELEKYLIRCALNKNQVVLIIDEAQSMPEKTLEALRLISNLETEKQKLVQIVLFGQPELDKTLHQENMRQLYQRITSSSKLNPLNNHESLALYLQQRMCLAGYRGLPIFSKKAIKRLWSATQGVPRLVNIIANKSLLVGYGAGSAQLDARHVDLAIKDTEFSYDKENRKTHWLYLLLLAVTAATAVVAL